MLRLHCVKKSDPNVIEINTFTRLVFDLPQLFRKGEFNLHRWHSNIPSLQSSNIKSERKLTYIKETQPILQKILGLLWDKNRDNLSVVVPEFNQTFIIKTNVLSYIVSIYNPLGLISTSHIKGKVIYRGLCDKKRPWDKEIHQILKKKSKKLVNNITSIPTEIPTSIPTNKRSITSVDLHVFGDGSILAKCVAVYVVVNQPSAISQAPVAGESRISKRDLSLPRLELVSAHMACNLISNMKSALKNQKARFVTGWTNQKKKC